MRTRKFIRKFHRWIGLIASLWLLLLATTGFLLQHSQQWKLDEKYITSLTLLKPYGIGKNFIAFNHKNQSLIQLDRQLIQNGVTTLKLTENINSAVYNQDNWIIATETQIFWIDENGQILQTMDELDGINLPINNIGLIQNQLIYQSNNNSFFINSKIVPTKNLSAAQWANPLTDTKLKQKAIILTSKNYISVEQFIFDIHAGITTPSILNDIAAVSLIILSLSGVFLFFRKRKRNRI